ncbi:NnrS family protein [Vibrio aestuarianus]|uniref:NnrS family protein n=1 Tax=Vibrio aestuarianus TaxID=28171 RepID=A0A9X4J184_9VIBR|nr:NnrS family protein [Vibrio aestuarianus]MDE1310327.1 NnrS family protein [Vibrio aestuarianus]MDE1331005.1 NnrS family protein [Vibrio aestuarianus]MDE1358307.1 NnrS family protein [Vibrio aestuarianus]NGZ18496.1 short-chain dehydrogenase [Vibrio aestuarianus]NGZ93488.1 short-chain dehydrogenase [Vibrio aestuarianus subsp. cardii]
MLNITDKKVEERIPAWLRLGFRPFFLLGSLYAIITISLWVWMFQAGQPSMLQVPSLWWHVHEMLFGFAMAIVVGFLLTAVQNWTGINGTKHYRLLLLVVLWLAPRVLLWTPVPLWLTSSIEALFLALAAYEIGSRVVKAKGWKNLFFVPLFVLAIAANFASYATIKGMPPFSSAAVWQAMLWWFTLLLSVMGARVIPFFTARRFNFEKAQPLRWLDWLANAPIAALFILSFFPMTMAQLGQPLMIVAGVAQLARFIRWKPWLTLSEPLVWSLHAAYVCLPLSLLLRGLMDNAFVTHNLIHLFAIGALAGVILAMIVRVTMGHTGRAIYQGPSMSVAFLALVTAAFIRSFGVAFFPAQLFMMVNISGALWVLAFSLFVWKFGSMLITPRVDGHPG